MKPKTLTPDQVAAVIDAIGGSTPTAIRDQCVVAFLAKTGARVSEVLNLRVEDVDGSVRIQDSSTFSHRCKECGTTFKRNPSQECPKCGTRAFWRGNKTGARTFAFPASLTPYLDAWLAVRYKSLEPEDWLFTTSAGGQHQPTNIRTKLTKVAQELGLARVTPHMFRHTVATEFIEQYGAEGIAGGAKALGHTAQTMVRKYAEIRDQEAADDMMGRR